VDVSVAPAMHVTAIFFIFFGCSSSHLCGSVQTGFTPYSVKNQVHCMPSCDGPTRKLVHVVNVTGSRESASQFQLCVHN